MKYFEGFHLNGWFGDFSTWLWIVFGWLILSIITALIFGMLTSVDRGEGE